MRLFEGITFFEHAILFAATLLCARKLLPLMETDEPKPAQEFLTEHFRWRAVEQAHRPLGRVWLCRPVDLLALSPLRVPAGASPQQDTIRAPDSRKPSLQRC